jgi:fatty acid desaturase
MNDTIDNELVLKTAKKRVGFKKHLTVFILVNLLFWVVFYFIFKGKEGQTFFHTILFVLITWTIIIIGHYFYAIKWNKKMLEKEIESIMKEAESGKQKAENL